MADAILNPASIVDANISGKRAKQDMEFTGLKMGALQQDIQRQKRQEEKAERLAVLTGEAMSASDPKERKAAYSALGAMGPEGAQTAAGVQAIQAQEQAQALEMTRKSLHVLDQLPKAEIPETIGRIGKFAEQTGLISGDVRTQLDRLARLSPDKAVFAARNLAGFEAPEEDDRINSKTVTMVNVEDPTQVRRYDLNNKKQAEEWATLDGNWYPEPNREETGGVGATRDKLTSSQKGKVAIELTEAEIATQNMVDQVSDLVGQINENPDAFASGGSLAGFVSGIGAEAESLARAGAKIFGEELADGVLDEASYADTFTELGVENARAQGALFDLALAYAAAIGLGQGRALTDKDVNRALRRIGAEGINTPEARIAILQDVRNRVVNNFKNRYNKYTGSEYEGDFGYSPEAPDQTDPGDVPRISNDAEFNELPSGAEFIDPDGVVRRKP